MLPRLKYFDGGKREILEVVLHGSSKGFEESESVQNIFKTARDLGRCVVMFNFPYIDRKEEWQNNKPRDEEISTLREVLEKCKANEYRKIRLIGKSLGGMVAADYLSSLSKKDQEKYELVILGFLPHETRVNKIFSKITIFQGSQDRYGNAGMVREDVLGAVSEKIVVHEIGGANHSFKDPTTGVSHFGTVLKLLFNNHIVENEKKSKGRKKAPEIEPVIMRFDWDCGGAAFCDDLLMMKRDDVLKTNIYERLEVNPIDGTKSQNIKKVCEEEGIEYIETTGATLEDLEYWLNNEYVCLISYQAWGSEQEMDALESGHYSTVFSIDEEGVWLLDPSIDTEEIPDAGKGVICVKKQEFDKRWIDKGVEGEVYDHWLLAMKSPGAQSDKI